MPPWTMTWTTPWRLVSKSNIQIATPGPACQLSYPFLFPLSLLHSSRIGMLVVAIAVDQLGLPSCPAPGHACPHVRARLQLLFFSFSISFSCFAVACIHLILSAPAPEEESEGRPSTHSKKGKTFGTNMLQLW